MRRAAFTILASLSAFVAAFVAIGWARSYRVIDYVDLRSSRPDDAPPRTRALRFVSACGQLRVQFITAPLTNPKQVEPARHDPFADHATGPIDGPTRAGISASQLSFFLRRHLDPAGTASGNARLVVPHLLPLVVALVVPSLWLRAWIRRCRPGAAPARPRAPGGRLSNLLAATSAAGCIVFLALCVTSFFAHGQSVLTYGAGTTDAELSFRGRDVSLGLNRGRLGIFATPYDVRERGPGYARMFSFDWTWSPLAGIRLPAAGQEPRLLRALGFAYGAVPAKTSSGTPVTRVMLILPLYPFMVVLALFPARVFRRHRRIARARDRVAGGQCPACGYDVRATPDRCPECGTPAAAAPSVTTPP